MLRNKPDQVPPPPPYRPRPNAQCPMTNAQRPTPDAQCPVPDARCPMPSAQRPMPTPRPPPNTHHPEQVKTLSTGLDLMIGMAILGALLTRVAASLTRVAASLDRVAASLTRIAVLAPTVAACGTYGCRRAVPHALGRGASPRDDHAHAICGARLSGGATARCPGLLGRTLVFCWPGPPSQHTPTLSLGLGLGHRCYGRSYDQATL